MSMPKWLLPQMTKMGTTCSKKRRFKTFFFSLYTHQKHISDREYSINLVSKCCQNVVKFRFWSKRKSPKSLIYNNLGDFLGRCLAELKFRIKMKGFVCEIFVVV